MSRKTNKHTKKKKQPKSVYKKQMKSKTLKEMLKDLSESPKALLKLNISMIIITIIGCFIMLEYSSGSSLAHVSDLGVKYILLNGLTLGVLWAAFMVIFYRTWFSCLLCTLLCGIVAVINYYIIMYHGSPLGFMMIKNFTTAMGVVSSYSFSIDKIVAVIVTIMILLSAMSFVGCYITKKCTLPKSIGLKKRLLLVTISVLVMYIGYFGENPIKPKKTFNWLWKPGYHKYGYVACTVESIVNSFNIVNEPEGYNKDDIMTFEIKEQKDKETETPDIILIMNETFYDLRQVADIETDVPFLENIENMENVLYGYSVVPGAGGGTNSSEYEFLTSNSLRLMPGVSPFIVMDIFGANSIVKHMNELGYHTVGGHIAPAQNYARGQGYTALGFKETHFSNDFLDIEYYNKRIYGTDESAYKNLIRWYEESPDGVPHFQYLLTIQNHGSWSVNDSEYDTVHVQKDFGEYTEPINEFLTGIRMSDIAFKELTDYFAQQERPVIVCMVGDHSPNFTDKIVDEKYTEQEKELLLRKVPLVIWANFDLGDQDLGTMSLNYVVPTLLHMAGVTLSPYYSYMLEMKESVPILSSYGVYYDKDGNIYRYNDDEGSAYESLVDNYFYLEYNNLQQLRRQELFEPW
ncbi:MAG: LTA synthase family protein [Lachnospiraceae bacterium]|nr:LTA synthase family protein [Lachnospiraceae bacterium]